MIVIIWPLVVVSTYPVMDAGVCISLWRKWSWTADFCE